MMNVYNGNVTLDANGRATVELPDYFEALTISEVQVLMRREKKQAG